MSPTAKLTAKQGFDPIALLLEGRAFFALIAIIVVFSLLSPHYFSLANFLIMASHVAIYGILETRVLIARALAGELYIGFVDESGCV